MDKKKKIAGKMRKPKYDLVNALIEYETGNANEKATSQLFKHLKKTGIGSKLQGHYSSRM